MTTSVLDIEEQGPTAGTAAHALRQAARFAAVGILCTAVHLGLFAALVPAFASTQAANLVALLPATALNTGLNRRWTFGVQGAGRARHQAQGLAVFGLTWLMTAGALGLVHLVAADPPTVVATGVLAVATAVSTVVRFVAMRRWIFRPPARAGGTRPPAAAHRRAGHRAALPPLAPDGYPVRARSDATGRGGVA